MRNPYYQGPASDHFDGLRFFNPDEPTTDRRLAELLRWRWSGKRSIWPESVPVTPTVPEARVSGLRITVVGHATLLIQAAGLNILTDPVWSERASPLRFAGPKRATAPGVAFEDLPPIDAVLLSHNHYDHLDLDSLKRLHERFAPVIVTPLGNDTILRRAIPSARITAGDWGSRFELAGAAQISIVPANHWSARGARDRRMALWSGFVLRTRAGSVYFVGDTGYGSGNVFREIRRQHGVPDVALIPIGAYEPRWFMSAQHCDPEEAVRILLDTGATSAIGIHWGTFNLTDEPRQEPSDLLAEALRRHGIDADRFRPGTPGMVLDAPVRRGESADGALSAHVPQANGV